MQKSILKEVIQNVVSQKLLEAKGRAPQYGYVISGKGTDDPVLQLIGYGNMRTSAWKRQIESDVKELLRKVQAGDWHNAAHMIEQNGVLSSALHMLDEIENPSKLEEVGDTNSAAAANPTVSAATTPQERDQQELEKNEKTLTDLTNRIKAIDADIAKLQEPVKKKVARLEMQKSQLSRRQGPVIEKINQLKKKLATYTPAQTQQP